ncbi:MAG: redoxin domain-containing protein [Desulfobacter sp.]
MKQVLCIIFLACLAAAPPLALGASQVYEGRIYDPGILKPVDSKLKVVVGQKAPDFTLRAVSGNTVTLSRFKDKNNVLITFVPAAWTPVCSDQWPGYNLARPLFEQKDTVLLGITTDNIPSLYAWTWEMGDLWFEVLSDFWPHGKTADAYGVLRTDGTAERALILVDKQGIIQWIHVSDINIRPELGMIIEALNRLD